MSDPEAPPAREALARGIVTVDVVSDVVCPWCFIGKRRLEAAIARSGLAVEVHWRPFQLDPTLPPLGRDRQDYLVGKFGTAEKVAAIHARLAAAGEAEGLAFAFDRIRRAPNTLDAHRVIRWSASAGRQGEVVEALFRAYFLDGEDIGDRKVLVGLAERCGLDATLVHRLLASGTDENAVRDEIASAVRLGVTGVPFFILAGRYAVAGAQDATTLAAALLKARQSPE